MKAMRRNFGATFLLFLLCLAPTWGQQSNGGDAAYGVLSTENVYVAPDLPVTVDPQRLEQAATQGQGNPHTRVKIAVLSQIPPGYRNDVNRYAGTLHKELGLDKNALVVVVPRNAKGGVSISVDANGLSHDEEYALAREAAAKIKGNPNPTQAISDLAEAAAQKINLKEYRGASMTWLIFLVVVGVIGYLIFTASRQRKAQMLQMRQPIDALRGNVLQGIEYLDGYMDVLPKNNPDSDQVRIHRQAASAKFEQAAKILDRATETSDLSRAQGLLDRAQADIAQARKALDRATGGTGNIPGDDALRPEPLPEGEAAVQAIPPKQRGVSFFSSQPAPVGSLVPVTITVNGPSRQVLVTPQEADELRQGRMPQVRAFQVNGRYVPWYEYPGYDPYNDYWRYEYGGWGLGTGLLTGFLAAEALDSLYYQPALMGGGMGGGYGGDMGYAFATDAPAYQTYADSQNGGDYGSMGDFGGGSDYTGAGDFGGGGDFGNADNGGGFDSGGGDFGGGGDSGGSDSGGGGGDF